MAAFTAIDYGAFANDPTADDARTAFQKIDNNFDIAANLTTDNIFEADIGMGVAPTLGRIHIFGSGQQQLTLQRSPGTNNSVTGKIFFATDAPTRGASIEGKRGSDSSKHELNLYTMDTADVPLLALRILPAGIYGNTTANAANMYIDSGGIPYRSTSSEKYKDIIGEIDTEYSKKIYDIARKAAIFYKSKSTNDNKDWTWYGISAEKLAEIEPRLVHWGYLEEDYKIIEKEIIDKYRKKQVLKERVLKKNAKLRPVGVQYERIIPLILVEMQKQEERLVKIEKKLNI